MTNKKYGFRKDQMLFTPESTVSKTDELLQGTDKC
jgi:hypothetical protein